MITATRTPPAVVRRLPGLADYVGTWETMQRFTATRDATTADEVWLLEHPPVYTLGLNGDPAHVLGAGAIPVVRTDRGGQVTFHGPGQLVVYLLMDIARAQLGIRDVVTGLERAVIELAAGFGIEATARRDAPGVYVRGAKLASIGLRVRHGATYHGMALNVAMDLAPFQQINPCGHAGLGVTQLRELGGPADVDTAAARLLPHLMPALGLSPAQMSPA